MRTFTMSLEPNGISSKILLDGQDISDLLVGIEVRSGVDKPTEVVLMPSIGHRADLVACLPEAQVIIFDGGSNAGHDSVVEK